MDAASAFPCSTESFHWEASSPAAAAANSSPANSVLRTVKGMLRCSPGANSTSEASAKATSS